MGWIIVVIIFVVGNYINGKFDELTKRINYLESNLKALNEKMGL